MSCVRNDRKIYVANISQHATEKDIGSLFEDCGRIASLEHKGNFGFIEFETNEGAAAATRKLNDHEFMGKRLIVKVYRYRGGDFRYNPNAAPNPAKFRGPRNNAFRLFVTGLSDSTSWQDVKDFARTGGSSVCYTEVYQRTGDKHGVIEYYRKEDFEYALQHLDRARLNGCRVRVYDKDPSGGGGSGYQRNDRNDRNDRSQRGSNWGQDRHPRTRSRSRSRSRSRDRDRGNTRGGGRDFGGHRGGGNDRRRSRSRSRERNFGGNRDRTMNRGNFGHRGARQGNRDFGHRGDRNTFNGQNGYQRGGNANGSFQRDNYRGGGGRRGDRGHFTARNGGGGARGWFTDRDRNETRSTQRGGGREDNYGPTVGKRSPRRSQSPPRNRSRTPPSRKDDRRRTSRSPPRRDDRDAPDAEEKRRKRQERFKRSRSKSPNQEKRGRRQRSRSPRNRARSVSRNSRSRSPVR